MSLVSDVLIPIVIVVGTLVVLFGLFRLGKVMPGLAYYPPALVIILGMFALAFLGLGVANIVLKFAPAFILHALTFGGGLAFGYGALDTATYRLTLDASGFRIHRFARRPLEAAWSQVTGLRWLTTAEVQIDLVHADQPKAHVSSFLIGSRNFIAALHQNAAHKG